MGLFVDILLIVVNLLLLLTVLISYAIIRENKETIYAQKEVISSLMQKVDYDS